VNRLDEYQKQALEYAALVDEGFIPSFDRVAINNGKRSAHVEAAARWGMTVRGVQYRLDAIRRAGFSHIIDAAVDRYNERRHTEPLQAREYAKPQLDPLEEHKLAREVNRLRSENRELLERLAGAGDFMSALEGVAEPLEPVSFQARKPSTKAQPETAVLVLSDLQWGETIDLAVMDGLNSYNPKIARNRLARVFQVWADLLTSHWAGPPPERIILVLGGDLISGEIHEELAKTNGLLSIPALRDCAAHICAGIRLLREKVGVPIDVLSVPGNHGRTTRKPESKLYAAHSYDTLCADIVELEFREGGKLPSWLTMWKPSSGDALIWVYGYRVLITHGDRIGSRGGAGFVGTAATVARGFKKLVMDYAGRGITLDFIVCGHFHTALQLEEGICNGALPGPSEYSRDLRFRPRPAVQAFIALHPRRGVTQIRWVDAGDPSEGSLYEPKTPPLDGGKPRFRIPAIGEPA
jgi:hypothetical protein